MIKRPKDKELKDKELKDKADIVNNICLRKLKNIIYSTFNVNESNLLVICKGNIYKCIHLTFISVLLFLTLFNVNIFHLIIILIIISLDAFSIVILHGCPLTILEKKYLHYDTSDERRDFIEKQNIFYNCDHEYEKQIELLINSWSLVAFKCLSIIFFRTFHIKLNDLDNIYV